MRKQLTALAITVTLAAGCGGAKTESAPAKTGANGKTSAFNTSYLLKEKPGDAQGVGEARKSVQDADTVTLVGRIGGSVSPFVDGIAAFTIVDNKVPFCAPDEGCPTPWDYCCTQDQVKDNIASVRVVNDEGKPVAEGAKELLGLKELDTVIVKGKAKRDDAGNLVVLADKVFIDKK